MANTSEARKPSTEGTPNADIVAKPKKSKPSPITSVTPITIGATTMNVTMSQKPMRLILTISNCCANRYLSR